MGRYIRNTTVLAKIESTYGTDASPAGASDAILVSDVNIDPIAENVSRDLIRPFMGASEELMGTKHIRIGMTVELQGSGTAGTAPAWGKLLRACAFAESVLATPDRVEYSPLTTGHESVTIYYYVDGVLYKATGCRGTVSFDTAAGSRPTMRFEFTGTDAGKSAASPSGVDFSAFITPIVVTDDTVQNFLLGCSYSAGALSGGTAYVSRGLTFDVANDVQFIPTLNGESADIVGRDPGGQMTLDLDAAGEVSMLSDIDANTLTSLGMELGSVAGKTFIVYAPKVQRINPKHEDVSGRVMLGMDLRITPDSGNDELTIALV